MEGCCAASSANCTPSTTTMFFRHRKNIHGWMYHTTVDSTVLGELVSFDTQVSRSILDARNSLDYQITIDSRSNHVTIPSRFIESTNTQVSKDLANESRFAAFHGRFMDPIDSNVTAISIRSIHLSSVGMSITL